MHLPSVDPKDPQRADTIFLSLDLINIKCKPIGIAVMWTLEYIRNAQVLVLAVP